MAETIASPIPSSITEQAYQEVSVIAKTHYENFPVASFFLPKKLRNAFMAIYAFARTADDFADEGNLSQEERLFKLQYLWQALVKIQHGETPSSSMLMALSDTIHQHKLPMQPFFDILIAFRQDVLKNRYQNFSEVLTYCQYSANPIGRLLLHLTGNATPLNLADSDKICTSLQLINFLQDFEEDLKQRDRCYLPMDELTNACVSLDDIRTQRLTTSGRRFFYRQAERAHQLLQEGSPLGHRLNGLFGLEIRLIIYSAQLISERLLARRHYFKRPTLKKLDSLSVLYQAIRNKRV